MKGYTQGRVIFDRYLDVSLKDKTRAKRAASSVTIEFKVHDDMSIASVSQHNSDQGAGRAIVNTSCFSSGLVGSSSVFAVHRVRNLHIYIDSDLTMRT